MPNEDEAAKEATAEAIVRWTIVKATERMKQVEKI